MPQGYAFPPSELQLIKELLENNFPISHFIQHNLIDLYSSESLHGNIFLSSDCKMITADKRFACINSMDRLYPFYKVLAFFAHGIFAFRIFEIWRIGRIYTPYIICKKFVLDFKPFFLLRQFVKTSGNFMSCHCGDYLVTTAVLLLFINGNNLFCKY